MYLAKAAKLHSNNTLIGYRPIYSLFSSVILKFLSHLYLFFLVCFLRCHYCVAATFFSVLDCLQISEKQNIIHMVCIEKKVILIRCYLCRTVVCTSELCQQFPGFPVCVDAQGVRCAELGVPTSRRTKGAVMKIYAIIIIINIAKVYNNKT